MADKNINDEVTALKAELHGEAAAYRYRQSST